MALSPSPTAPIPSCHRWNPFRCIVSVPALSIGHCFGIIPASGSFASTAFAAPPNKSSETRQSTGLGTRPGGKWNGSPSPPVCCLMRKHPKPRDLTCRSKPTCMSLSTSLRSRRGAIQGERRQAMRNLRQRTSKSCVARNQCRGLRCRGSSTRKNTKRQNRKSKNLSARFGGARC